MFTSVLTFGIYAFGYWTDVPNRQLYNTIIVQP